MLTRLTRGCISLFLACLISCPASSEVAPLSVPFYSPPSLIDGTLILKYPQSKLEQSQEAWVDLSFMVGADGKPTDIIVTDSSGSRVFGQVAVKALAESNFQPALLNSKPIPAGENLRIYFVLSSNEGGASSLFAARFRGLMKSLAKGKMDKAKRSLGKLEQMDIHNLYEDAYLNIARYQYALAIKAPYGEQLRYLTRALAGPKQHLYLPTDLYLSSLESKFKLEAYVQDYRAALSTYKMFEKYDEQQLLAKNYQSAIEQIQSIKEQTGSYMVDAKVDKSGYWHLGLYKNRFSIHNLQGKLSELQLYCSARHAVLPVTVDQEYLVPDAFGDCRIYAKGVPDTTFQLQQTTL